MGGYASRFDRFILLDAAGVVADEDGIAVAPGTPDSPPLYRFMPVRARLYGVELEGRVPCPVPEPMLRSRVVCEPSDARRRSAH